MPAGVAGMAGAPGAAAGGVRSAPLDAADRALAALGPGHGPAARRRHGGNLRALLDAMAAHGRERDDPVRTVPALLGDRWSSLVMNLLAGGMLRHGELRRLIGAVSSEGQISQRMLTLKLRLLERDGLVAREVTVDTPPRVEYALTALGAEAHAHYLALLRWTEQATPAIRAARAAFDERQG